MPFLDKFDYKFDFIGKRRWAFALSALLLLLAMGSLVTRGLVFGLDFTGGTLVEVGYESPVTLDVVRNKLHDNGFPDAVVQYFGTTRDVSIRLGIHVTTPDNADSASIPTTVAVPENLTLATDNQPPSLSTEAAQNKQALSTQILDLLRADGDKVEIRRVEFVGPQVGGELVEKGGLAILLTLLGVLIYVALRFEYRFALGAIAALVHDTVITIGVFSVFALEFDLTVMAAILAVIGYSLNDTIVVFDRVRDNFLKLRKYTPVEVVNVSINQMLGRTIMTSFTTILVLIVLFVMGGELIHGFSTALLVGIIIGTYSSIYIASTTALALNISKADLMPVEKEGLKTKES
jgi:preprotein translocase subunit SecF